MQHRDEIVIKKIIEEIEIGISMLGTIELESFLQDEKLKRAIAMTVINIGELIKNVGQEVRNAHQEIPWREAAGMRDLAAHKYQTLRMEDVYYTVKKDFPLLHDELKKII